MRGIIINGDGISIIIGFGILLLLPFPPLSLLILIVIIVGIIVSSNTGIIWALVFHTSGQVLFCQSKERVLECPGTRFR